MLYVTTRNEHDAYTTHRAIHSLKGTDGGDFLPFRMPALTQEEIAALKEKARAILPQKVAYWSAVTGLKPTGIKITTARKRYGSCSGQNSLCFSCFLMRCPEEAIDLVVVHELCHIKEKNHGPRFYTLLEHYLPDYRERKKLLH